MVGLDDLGSVFPPFRILSFSGGNVGQPAGQGEAGPPGTQGFISGHCGATNGVIQPSLGFFWLGLGFLGLSHARPGAGL